MRRAVKDQLLNPQPNAIQRIVNGKANLYGSLMNSVVKQREQALESSPWLGQQASWQLPTTRRYLQSRSPAVVPSVQPDPALAWMIELARFPVPFGSIGILKSFEQYISQGEDVFTTSQYWGDPFPFSVPIRWYFRLSSLSTVGAPWINATGLSAVPDYLPGTPYDDFSQSIGTWFPAGSSGSANIHLPIPGGQSLRLVCLIGASQTAVRVAGKLAGTIQIETNKDAQFVVRTTW